MIAAVTSAVDTIEIVDVAEPAGPGPGEVVVRPEAVGICGSDFHFLDGSLKIFDSSPYPRIQGHEVGATIEAVGPGCRAELAVGRRVALWPLTACGECYPCSVGRGNACDNFELIGIHVDGGLQERLTMPEEKVFPIDVGRADIAALVEPVSIAVRAANRASVGDGEPAVVLGAGPIGQAVQLLVRERGGVPLVVDPLQSRVELTREMGAAALAWEDADQVAAEAREWAGGELPLIFDATGAPSAIRSAVEMVASAGRVVIVGMSGEEVPLRVQAFVDKELDVLGVSCCGGGEFAEAVGVVERRAEVLERLVSHSFPLERAPEALDYAMENPSEVMKVMISGS
jgi:threonine dehydrogenase-like Zn-dependent dehydrogenase